jgi:periplasmic divalent cation tolerance protein
VSDPVLLTITFPAGPLAEQVAHDLVHARLAAAAHVTPVRSVYRWQGQVCHADETTLTLRTLSRHVETITAHIRSVHPYQVPALVVTDVDIPSPQYLDWLHTQLQ